MNYEEKIAGLEADYRSPFPKEYRSLLENSPEGLVLDKERHVGNRIERMRFFLGFGDHAFNLLDATRDLDSWSNHRYLPIILNMSGQYICINLSEDKYGQIYKTVNYEGHSDDPVKFKFVCNDFSAFWKSLKDPPPRVESEWLKLCKYGTAAECEGKIAKDTINSIVEVKRTLVEYAACYDNVSIVSWCLENGAAVGNALQDAFFNQSWNVIELLLTAGYGALREEKDKFRGVPLENAKWDFGPDEYPRFDDAFRRAEVNYRKKSD